MSQCDNKELTADLPQMSQSDSHCCKAESY